MASNLLDPLEDSWVLLYDVPLTGSESEKPQGEDKGGGQTAEDKRGGSGGPGYASEKPQGLGQKGGKRRQVLIQ